MDARGDQTSWRVTFLASEVIIFDSTVRVQKAKLISEQKHAQLKFHVVKIRSNEGEDWGTICTFNGKDDAHELNLLFVRGDVIRFDCDDGLVELSGNKDDLVSVCQPLDSKSIDLPRMWCSRLKGEKLFRFSVEIRLKNATIVQTGEVQSCKTTLFLKTASGQSEICHFEPNDSLNRPLDFPLPVEEEFHLVVDTSATVALIGERDPNVYGSSERVDHLLHLAKKTFVPVLEKRDDGLTASKFGGLPLCGPYDPWPSCSDCSQKLTFFLQLNSADLPVDAPKAFGSGIFQFFYCTNKQCRPVGFYKGHCCRVISIDDGDDSVEPEAECFPASTIVDWSVNIEYPCLEDPVREDSPDMNDYVLRKKIDAKQGEKLFGWPYFIHSGHYDDCSKCGEKMELLVQLDSERALPYMFGDVGLAYVFYCPSHEGEFGFGTQWF